MQGAATKPKAADAQQTAAVAGLAAGVPHVLLLSGTPSFGFPSHLFPLLDALYPGAFSDTVLAAAARGGARTTEQSNVAHAVVENRPGRCEFNKAWCGARARAHPGFPIEEHFDGHAFGDELGCIAGHFGPVNTLAFAPHGRSYTSGGEDGYVRIQHFDAEYFEAYEQKVEAARN